MATFLSGDIITKFLEDNTLLAGKGGDSPLDHAQDQDFLLHMTHMTIVPIVGLDCFISTGHPGVFNPFHAYLIWKKNGRWQLQDTWLDLWWYKNMWFETAKKKTGLDPHKFADEKGWIPPNDFPRSGVGHGTSTFLSTVAGMIWMGCWERPLLAGGNSNIFYFHPDPWGNDQIWRYNIFQMGDETTN